MKFLNGENWAELCKDGRARRGTGRAGEPGRALRWWRTGRTALQRALSEVNLISQGLATSSFAFVHCDARHARPGRFFCDLCPALAPDRGSEGREGSAAAHLGRLPKPRGDAALTSAISMKL